MVYVPLPHGNGEQELNALPVVQAGGGLLVPDDEMSPDWWPVRSRPCWATLRGWRKWPPMAVGGHRDAATRGFARRWNSRRVTAVADSEKRGSDQPMGQNESAELPAHLQRVHMVGIGGAGMSGLARILLERGGAVSGSDAKDGRAVLALRTRGAVVTIGHDPSALDSLPDGPTVVVSTRAAIPDSNPELVEARERGSRW